MAPFLSDEDKKPRHTFRKTPFTRVDLRREYQTTKAGNRIPSFEEIIDGLVFEGLFRMKREVDKSTIYL